MFEVKISLTCILLHEIKFFVIRINKTNLVVNLLKLLSYLEVCVLIYKIKVVLLTSKC